jgi:hypothetical protein
MRRPASSKDLAASLSGATLSAKMEPLAGRTLSRPASAQSLTKGSAEWRSLSRPGSAKSLARALRLSQRPTSAGDTSATISRPTSAGKSWNTLQLDVTLNLPDRETPEKENRPPRQRDGFQGTGRFPKDQKPPGPRKKVASKVLAEKPADAANTTRRHGAEEDVYLAEHSPHADRKDRRYPNWLYDNDPRRPPPEAKVYVNGFEQKRAMGKDPHLAGQVKHPLPFRSTIAGPQGKSFSHHGPNPADPVSFHVKLNPFGPNFGPHLQKTPGISA